MKLLTAQTRIGFDFGDTIVKVDADENDLFRGDTPWLAEPFPEAIERIARIVEVVGSHNAFIVSKVKSKATMRTPEWFIRNDFFAKTGMLASNVHYCESRAEKVPIIQELGLTHFVDNRQDVQFYIQDIVTHRLLFRPDWTLECEVADIKNRLKGHRTVDSWQEVEEYFLTSIS
jgi:hypothetical protein